MVKILYVEDNEDNLYMLSNRLTRRGYEVVSARDGQQGIAMAEQRGAGSHSHGFESADHRRLGGDTTAQGRSR